MRFEIQGLPGLVGSLWKYGSTQRKLVIFVALMLLGLAATSLASIHYGMQLYKSKRAENLDMFVENLVASHVAVVPQWIKGVAFGRPERLEINIKRKHFAELAQRRNEALQRGILINEGNTYVPAVVSHGDGEYAIKLRLKGDWTDHLLGNKWSFRVKVKGNDTLFGMKQFSLHHPRARNFAHEWLFHRAVQREDILSLRYDFVEVTLNGQNLGVYALEEHFEKRLIEHQSRREGPIIKLNENLMWADRAVQPHVIEGSPTGIQSEHSAWVDAFGDIGTPAAYARFQVAQNLVEGFRYGNLPAHQVFDVEKMATFLALSDLLGSPHAVVWHNLRFYLNPVTSRLEPVGFDANPGEKLARPVGSSRDWNENNRKYKDLAFTDPVFYAAYTRALERVSRESYLDELLRETRDELDDKLAILWKEFPWFHYSDAVFHRNRKVIESALNPVKGVHAYHHSRTQEQLVVEVGNLQGMALEVDRVVFNDSLMLVPAERVILPPKVDAKPVQYQRMGLDLPADLATSTSLEQNLVVHYRVLGAETGRSDAVFAWRRWDESFAANDFMRQPANARGQEFLDFDEEKKRILVRPGTWRITEDVIIPPGYDVVCDAGTELVLSDDATLLSRSRLEFQGTESNPIVVRSDDGSGRGLVVLETGEQSNLEHVSFIGLSNPSSQGWSLTGAVTFYEAPVRLWNCLFAENVCEDALNILRTTFEIDNCVFSRTSSDAFDADFADGSITNSLFVNSGNDAIDVSGSVVQVVDTRIEDTGDKGLSGGENSVLIVQNVDLVRAAIAVASKDLTEVRIDGIRIVDTDVGMTLFQKKPEFGAASMVISNLDMASVQVPYLVEDHSKLVIDGSRVRANRRVVKDELYGKRWGKRSRR